MYEKDSLYILLSLGHNSSAVGIKNGEIVTGYEEERFTREKASSKFPINAIEEIFKYSPPDPNVNNYFVISHWYDNFNFMNDYHSHINKHFNYKKIKEYCKKYNFKIMSLDEETTHHDAHAESSISFLENHIDESSFSYKDIKNNTFILVFDGFGNKQEICTLYKLTYKKGKLEKKLINRKYGYISSLGLMYQYATSYCGMKEHEDEYKFLGYETKISEVLNKDGLKLIKSAADGFSELWVQNLLEGFKTKYMTTPDDKYINVDQLKLVKNKWNNSFNEIIKNIDDSMYVANELSDDVIKRAIIGYFIQNIIEIIHQKIIKHYKIKNVLLSGGLYYNVKLNNTILKSIPGFICVTPLAGDQGAPIGLYYSKVDKFPYKDLRWGKRSFGNIENFSEELRHYVEFVNNEKELTEAVFNNIRYNVVVQVLNNNLEFGPRALCSSSTLALASKENVDKINTINGRNTVMPFAPVTIPQAAKILFKTEYLERIIGSDRYMIIAIDYKNDIKNDTNYIYYKGVSNPYPDKEGETGRPQIVHDENSFVYKVIERLYRDFEIGAIINTSLNVHGKPIVFTLEDAISDFRFNLEKIKNTGMDIQIKLIVLL